MLHHPRSRLAAFVLIAGLAACGGGGGGGGGSGAGGGSSGGGTTLTLGLSTVSFVMFEGDQDFETINVSISWTGSNVAGYAIGTLPGVSALPGWLTVANQGTTSPSQMLLTRGQNALQAGRYTTTIRVVTADASQNVLQQVDLPITLDVVPRATITPGNVSMSWVESEEPVPQQLTVVRDDRVQLVSATTNVDWLAAATAGDTITLSGTAAARSKLPGNAAAGHLRVTFAIGSKQRLLDVALTGTVSRALTAPAELAYAVTGSTTADDLANRTATIMTATQAPVSFAASTDAPWLTAAGGSTVAANNLVLQLIGNELRQMANGEYSATISIAPTTPNVSPLQIAATLTINLPEVHFVAPVAFTDTVATETVVVRGRGLSDPNIDLRIAGQSPAAPTVVNDTELRLVAGPLTAGDYEVTVANELGFTRRSALLRVTDPPAYGDFEMALAAFGPQEKIVSSPINGVVYTSRLTGPLHLFRYVAGSWAQPVTAQVFQNGINDFALSPDESELIVLADSNVYRVDPVTLQVRENHPLPFPGGGRIAVTNDGLVILDDLSQTFSLVSETFAVLPAGYAGGAGPAASRDGSRVLIGRLDGFNPAPIQYWRSATRTLVNSSAVVPHNTGLFNRNATIAYVGQSIYDADFGLIDAFPGNDMPSQRGDLSPDGTRAYGIGYPPGNTQPAFLRTFDVTGSPFVELAPITLPFVSVNFDEQIAVDPYGDVVFLVRPDRFLVIELP